MDLPHPLARYLLVLLIASHCSSGISYVISDDIFYANTFKNPFGDIFASTTFKNPLGDISFPATRALRSFQKSSKGLSEGSKEELFGRRHLLEGEKIQACSWDDGECGVSMAIALDFLSSSTSPIASLPFDACCMLAFDEAECPKQDWDWDGSTCRVGDTLMGPPVISECLGDAKKIVDLESIGEQCRESFPTDADACNGRENCTWDYDGGECGLDENDAYFGLPTIDGVLVGFDEAYGEYVNWLVASFLADGRDGVDILDWTPPPFKCPPNVNQLLCDYIAPVSRLFIDGVYCSAKHGFPFRGGACEADKLCAVDEDKASKCTISKNVHSEVKEEMENVLMKSVKSPLIREMVMLFIKCPNQEEAGCKRMRCSWDEVDGECGVDHVLIMKILGDVAKKNPEPACQMMGAAYESACAAIDPSECESEPKCEINEETGGCGPTEEVFEEAVEELVPSFGKFIKDTSKKCSAKTTEESCDELEGFNSVTLIT